MRPDLRLVTEATPAERRYRRQAARLLKDLRRLDAKSVREVARRTRRLRKELLGNLSEVSQWSAARLPVILAQVDAALTSWATDNAATAATAIDNAGRLGSELVGRLEVAAGAAELLTIVTPHNIEALSAATADLMVDVSTTIKSRVAAEARAAALGLQRPFEAIEKVAAIVPPVRTPRPDGTLAFRGPAARAEVIVRTEVNRAFSYAADRRLKDTATRLDEQPLKRWLTSIDGRERPDHAAADNQTVPHDKPFTVGGTHLQFPNDPAAPAEQVINCRCTMIPVMPSWSR